MKKIFYSISIIVTILTVFSTNSISQSFECRVIENDYGYLVYQMRETSGTNTPTTSTDINDITFVIRYPSSAVDMDLICSSNDYEIFDGLGGEQTYSGYDYHYWNASAVPAINPPSNWTQNVWVDIAIFKATGATGSGLFEVATDGWDGRSLNWNQTVGGTAQDFEPTISGSGVTYSYPTVVYDYVWTGASNTYWDATANWSDECGNSVGSLPTSSDNCVIPSGVANYPNSVQATAFFGQPTCNSLRINSGATVSLEDLDFFQSLEVLYTVSGQLIVYGTLNMIPNSKMTVSGDTYLDASECLVVQADASGVGSFIDNGTITYGASGSAKVQTYLTNSAGAGNFDIHLIGPTVDEENYTGTGTGAYLQAFAINSSTYAYQWDQSVDTSGGTSGWDNIYSNTFEVRTGKGIGLSTIDNQDHTLEMTGELITGNVSSPSLGNGNNNLEIISNPYPSAIDFDALATANSSVVNNKYWIWDPTGPNYIARASGSGGSQYIQVGQGFFVQTNSSGTFDFSNTERSHSTDPFRNSNSNELTVKSFGGQDGYHDELVVRFDENATSGYDIEIEAAKLQSQNSDATQISTVSEDNSTLSVNVLPLELLNTGLTSVPMNFSCGYNTEYELSFEDMETFEYGYGTEIWLEDKLTGEDWVNIIESPIYTFTATPDDQTDRFIIHFFGPTSIDEGLTENSIDIFSSGQFAYVRNNTGENIKKVNIFTLAGELLIEDRNAALKLNKYRVHDEIGYFVVRVITDKNVYTKKVLITK